jgi:hypothetical protein
MIDIFENFISLKDQNLIEEFVSSNAFPYRFQNIHNDPLETGSSSFSGKQLTNHLFMMGEEKQSLNLPIVLPIINSIQDKYGDIRLYRAKVNVTMPNPSRYSPQTPHTDLKLEDGSLVPHLVCLYYVNDSDGPTYFYDDDLNVVKEVDPKKGTAVVFDGDILHAGSNPVLNPFRFAININFLPDKENDE